MEWPSREWIRDHRDMYSGDVVVQTSTLTAMVAKLEAAARMRTLLHRVRQSMSASDWRVWHRDCAQALAAWDSARSEKEE